MCELVLKIGELVTIGADIRTSINIPEPERATHKDGRNSPTANLANHPFAKFYFDGPGIYYIHDSRPYISCALTPKDHIK